MKRFFVKVLCFVLSISAIIGPNAVIFAQAEEDEIKVYYSDLFYGYPTFLINNTYFQQYRTATNNLFDTVYGQYANSPAVIGTALEHAMDLVTSPSALGNFISDTLGVTDIDVNKAIDNANKKWMLSLAEGTYESDFL